MGIKINKNRVSDSYIGTFDYKNSDDMFQLDDLRTMVKHMNRDLAHRNAYADTNMAPLDLPTSSRTSRRHTVQPARPPIGGS